MNQFYTAESVTEGHPDMLSMRKNLPVPKTENRWKERSIRLSIKTSQNRIYSSQPSAVP